MNYIHICTLVQSVSQYIFSMLTQPIPCVSTVYMLTQHTPCVSTVQGISNKMDTFYFGSIMTKI